MQTQSKKFLLLSVLFVALLGGCKKNQKKTDSSDKSFFSKVHNKMKRKKGGAEQADPFDLNQDAMKTFALDDQLPKHQTGSKSAQPSEKPLFSWENINAEESKHQFKTLYFDFDKDVLKTDQHSSLKFDIDEAKTVISQAEITKRFIGARTA